MSATNFAAAIMLDRVVRTTLSISLHDGDPGATGANEISGGGYSRQSINVWFQRGARNAVSDEVVEFDTPSTTLTHAGIWRGATFIWGTALDESTAVTSRYLLQAKDVVLRIISRYTQVGESDAGALWFRSNAGVPSLDGLSYVDLTTEAITGPIPNVDVTGIGVDQTDSGDVWVTRDQISASPDFIRINTDDGSVLETITVAEQPRGFVFDGTHLWRIEIDDTLVNRKLVRANPSTGAAIDTYDLATLHGSNFGSAEDVDFDGSNLWLTDVGSDIVFSLSRTDASLLTSFSSPATTSGTTEGIAWDGSHIWVSILEDGEGFYKMTTSGNVVSNILVDNSEYFPSCISWRPS